MRDRPVPASFPPGLSAEGNRHPLLSLALAAMLDEVHAHSGAVYLMAPDGKVLEMAVTAGLPRAFAAPWERVGTSAPIPVADAVRERRLVWVGNDEEMAASYPRIAVVLPYPFALAALPVATRDTVYGAVYVTWPGSHPPTLSDWERDHLSDACKRLALRLERAARAGHPVQVEPDLLGDIAATGEPASGEAEQMVSRIPEGMLNLDLNARVTFVNDAAAGLVGLARNRLAGRQLWSALPWLNDPVYEDRYRAALISQQPTSFVALRPPRDWLSFRLHPSTSGLTVRIKPARTEPRSEPHTGDPTDVGPARLIVISHVLSLAGGLTEAVGVDDVIELVEDEFMPAVGCQALVMLAAEAGRLHVLGHRGYDDPHIVERFHGMPLTAQTPGAQALVTGVPSFFESLRELEQVYPTRQTTRDGMAAWAYLPLISSGRPVGTCVLGYAEPHHFPPDERAVLTSLGGLIAQALERARLYDTKHRLAHGLQAALMPHSLPELSGLERAARYLPANRGMDIGGDFYDLVRGDMVHGDEVGPAAFVGDVQGHNVTAAGLMGQVRTAVRAFTAVGQPPGEVMARTNRLLIDLDTELFVSCVYAQLDLVRNRARIARAGHPHPLLREPDGSVHVVDIPGGALLGIDENSRYPVTDVPLPPGCVLVLYTDGLVEVPGIDFDEGLADLGAHLSDAGELPLEELADSLLRHTERTHERGDDVALLLLRPH
ncbi:SpoIIE family protein phosphatase [Streptomyces sp. FIT100]|uniref:SpoIIE family protein phosphatase n=1 Tax=Streptomyces sp. FIT100 TaxID=2837956 RepID=UPI0022015DD3|nr:SpoIIE family protein phosphatase [Streptomyces sp. FIT100]